jgi:hypothetical protein
MHRRVLVASEMVLGANQPNTLMGINNLGLVLSRQGSTKRPRRCIDGPWQDDWVKVTVFWQLRLSRPYRFMLVKDSNRIIIMKVVNIRI